MWPCFLFPVLYLWNVFLGFQLAVILSDLESRVQTALFCSYLGLTLVIGFAWSFCAGGWLLHLFSFESAMASRGVHPAFPIPLQTHFYLEMFLNRNTVFLESLWLSFICSLNVTLLATFPIAVIQKQIKDWWATLAYGPGVQPSQQEGMGQHSQSWSRVMGASAQLTCI